MKVGIVTVHDSANIGSFLQALGMQELVRQNGDEPFVIKTRSEFSTFCLFLGYYNVPGIRSVKKFMYFVAGRLKHFPQTWKMIKKYAVYKREREVFENIISVNKSKKIKLDVLLLGSDEIWNTKKVTFRNPLLYGIGILAPKKLGYAISIGDMEQSGWNQYEELLAGIKNLDGILVRDERTRKVIENYEIQVDERICDPTLQVDIRKYMKTTSEVKLPVDDYIAVYSYSVDENTKKIIQRIAEKNHLKTVAISLEQPWCDEYINCSPLEFGAVFSKANMYILLLFMGQFFQYYTTNSLSCNRLARRFWMF